MTPSNDAADHDEAAGSPADAVDPGSEALLDAALDEFADLGYDGTSVRALARRLGVHHNHFPQRFGTKERLWYAAVDHGFERLYLELVPVLTETFPDEMSHLRALLVRFVEVTSARPAILQVIGRESVTGGARFDYLYDRYIGPTFDEVRNLFDELAAKGRVRSGAAHSVLFFSINGSGGGPAAFPHLMERLEQPSVAGDPAERHRHAVESVDQLFEGLSIG